MPRNRPEDRKAGEGTKAAQSADFAAFLATVRPKTVRELGDTLRDLTGKVLDTGKKGTLTLTITLTPIDGGDALSVNDEIRVKAPEHTRQGSIAYPDADGNLSRSDPNAMPLFRDEEDLRTAGDFDPRTGEMKEPPQ